MWVIKLKPQASFGLNSRRRPSPCSSGQTHPSGKVKIDGNWFGGAAQLFEDLQAIND
jgi:hypothetical protein